MALFARFSAAEAESTRQALDALRPLQWATELVRRVDQGGGLYDENKSLLFEVRVGRNFHDCGIAPVYEHGTGVGDTSVDFHFGQWLVEVLSLDETDAATAATWKEGPFFGRLMSSPQRPSPDERLLDEDEQKRRSDLRKQSPEGETLKVIERIVGKAQSDGEPSKFPPTDGAHWSILIVDLRSFSFGQIDRYDCRQIAYGAGVVPDWASYTWVSDDGREFPIIGAFHPGNRMRGARLFRERVHFLGLVAEETYDRDELQYFIRFYHNPALFRSEADARAVLRTFPLYQPAKTRERRPDLFLHELFEQSEREIQFGIVVAGRTVTCRVHLDTLEDLEQRGLKHGSDEMLQAFYRHDAKLERLASEMLERDMARSDGTIFIRPEDLKLVEHPRDGENEKEGMR